ncbi:MAG: PHP domain-containing protein [Planctomycetes bacterium]|nr:PHP domain-containing protein [Planctomycetota bacterium]
MAGRRLIDLHVHSNASDGLLPPAQVVRMAEAAGLAAVALTDHDTLAGLDEAAREAEKFPQMRFVRGIEVSAEFAAGTLHVLGLGIRGGQTTLGQIIDRLVEARTQRNPKIIARLQSLGMKITMDDVLAVVRQCGNTSDRAIVGRMHIGQALVKAGCVHSTDEAFRKYIGKDCPAFVDKERLTPRQVIEAIDRSGGIAVLAHPPQLRYANYAQLELLISEFASFGLKGLEVFHTDCTDIQSRQYLRIARRMGLMVSGGSDYHGPVKPGARIGRPRVPLAAIDEKFAKILFDAN